MIEYWAPHILNFDMFFVMVVQFVYVVIDRDCCFESPNFGDKLEELRKEVNMCFHTSFIVAYEEVFTLYLPQLLVRSLKA